MSRATPKAPAQATRTVVVGAILEQLQGDRTVTTGVRLYTAERVAGFPDTVLTQMLLMPDLLPGLEEVIGEIRGQLAHHEARGQ